MIKKLLLTILFTLMPLSVYGGDVKLAWNANPESDLAGYKVYHGESPRLLSTTYPNVIDVGNVTSYTVTGLVEHKEHYFAATAYDFSGNESGYSVEASGEPSDTTPPAIPIGVKVEEIQ